VKKILGSLFIKGKITTPINPLRSDNNSSFYKNPPEVVFFPHQGVMFGKHYLKDHFYDDDPESPLNSSSILHIELHQPPPKESVKYYANNNISHTVILGGWR
jgi:hypothetical protein